MSHLALQGLCCLKSAVGWMMMPFIEIHLEGVTGILYLAVLSSINWFRRVRKTGGVALIFCKYIGHSLRQYYLIFHFFVTTTVLKWQITSCRVPLDLGSCSWCLLDARESFQLNVHLVQYAEVFLTTAAYQRSSPKCYFAFNMVRGVGI